MFLGEHHKNPCSIFPWTFASCSITHHHHPFRWCLLTVSGNVFFFSPCPCPHVAPRSNNAISLFQRRNSRPPQGVPHDWILVDPAHLGLREGFCLDPCDTSSKKRRAFSLRNPSVFIGWFLYLTLPIWPFGWKTRPNWVVGFYPTNLLDLLKFFGNSWHWRGEEIRRLRFAWSTK